MRVTALRRRWCKVIYLKKGILIAFIVLMSFSVFAITTPKTTDKISFDPLSGLALSPGFELLLGHCSACHSAKLVTQNRMTRENWLGTIRWMQKSQGLWPLGKNEAIILDYLEAYYSPLEVSRRGPIPAHLMPPLEKAKKSY
jgi:cytochrome c1